MAQFRFGTWLTNVSAVGLAALLSIGLSGCGDSNKGDDLKVGFIYVGPKDDYGYSQAHAQGAAAVKKEVKGVKVLEMEKVPEDVAVQQRMKDMIDNDGVKAI